MSISPQQYVNIVSGVGASANIPTRALVARFFTGNSLVPPKSFVEFTSAAQVTAYFGSASEEALRANFYFSFLSKTLVQPASIQFARWTQADAAPMIQSSLTNNSVLSNWTSINNNSFNKNPLKYIILLKFKEFSKNNQIIILVFENISP